MKKKLVLLLAMAINVFSLASCRIMSRELFEEYTFDKVVSLNLEVGGFDVELIASERDGGKVEIIYPDHYSISCRSVELNSGNQIQIEAPRMEKLTMFNFARQKIILRVPGNIQVNLEGRSSNVTISDFTSIRGRFSTSSGDIKVVNSSGSLEMTTFAGNILMDGIKGVFNLKTSSGDIKAVRMHLEKNSSLKTGAGKINLDLLNHRENLQFLIDTRSGDIYYYGQRLEKDQHLGSGEIIVSMETGSGNIQIQ